MKTYLTDQCIVLGFKADRLTMKPKEKLMHKRLYQVKTKYDTNGDVSLFKKYMTKLDNDGYIYQKYAKKSKGGSFFNGKNLILLSKTVMIYLPITIDNINKSFSDEIVEAAELADNNYALVDLRSHTHSVSQTLLVITENHLHKNF